MLLIPTDFTKRATITDGNGVVKTLVRNNVEGLLTGVQYAYPDGYSGTQIPGNAYGY